jgi:hypothetical protein
VRLRTRRIAQIEAAVAGPVPRYSIPRFRLLVAHCTAHLNVLEAARKAGTCAFQRKVSHYISTAVVNIGQAWQAVHTFGALGLYGRGQQA